MAFKRKFRRVHRFRRPRVKLSFAGYKRRYKSKGKFNKLSKRKMPMLLPDRLRVPLIVSEEVNLASSGGVISSRVLRGNDAYDPDPVVGSSLEAAFFNEYAAMYDQVCVRGSAIEVQWNEVLTSNLYLGIAWALVPNTVSLASLTSVTQFRELKYAKSGLSTQYRGVNKVKHYMSTAKIYGQKPSVVTTEDDYNSTTTASPANIWTWTFVYQPADQTSTINLLCWIKMKLYCEFWRPLSKTT